MLGDLMSSVGLVPASQLHARDRAVCLSRLPSPLARQGGLRICGMAQALGGFWEIVSLRESVFTLPRSAFG